MSYSDLIYKLFGHERACIAEDEFIKKLPLILNKEFSDEDSSLMAFIIEKRLGLNGSDKYTFKDIGGIFLGLSNSTISNKYKKAMEFLKEDPFAKKEYVEKLTQEEINKIETFNTWPNMLSHNAYMTLRRMHIAGKSNKEYCINTFSKTPEIKTVSVSNDVDNIRFFRDFQHDIPIDIFNEIRRALNIDVYEPK